MECTLSPGTCDPAVYNIQPGTQYSGVHPTPSSSISQTGIRLLVLHLDHLITRKSLKTRYFATSIQASLESTTSHVSVTIRLSFNCLANPNVGYSKNIGVSRQINTISSFFRFQTGFVLIFYVIHEEKTATHFVAKNKI